MKSLDEKNRSLTSLNATQFLGALNDNLFKLILIFFLIDLQGVESAGNVAASVGGIFVVPFLLFSPIAGIVADRIKKSRIISLTKALEIVIMGIGTVALWCASPFGLYLSLFLMALQSTFFSPAKYGIVPEIVTRERLSNANGLIEAFTYLAIIIGTTTATLVPVITGDRYHLAGLICLAVACLGFVTSFGVKEVDAVVEPSGKGAVSEMRTALQLVRNDKNLAMAVIGASLFMLVGAFAQLNLIPLGIQQFGLSQEQSGALFLLAAFGIGAGSLAAGCLSGRNVELGIVPLGAAMLCLGASLLGLPSASLTLAALATAILGFGAGLFIVPLHAFIQFHTPQKHRGKVLAVTNFLGWSGVLIAALLTHLVSEVLILPAHYGFLGLGVFLVTITVLALLVLPDFLLRFVALALMRLIYRVRIQGVENVPVEGGALLVANHVSWLDSLLLLATQQRRIRFLMERDIYKSSLLRILFRLMRVIPISSKDSRKELVASLKAARQSLDDGYLVCIFAEGALTRNGAIQGFRPGFERIIKGSEHMVIPVHIGGIWGSIFSYKYGPLVSTLPKSLPKPVTIGFGRSLPSSCNAAEVRQAVMELSGDHSSVECASLQNDSSRQRKTEFAQN